MLLDARGYVRTGADAVAEDGLPRSTDGWVKRMVPGADRVDRPGGLETNRSGVFAVDDVRSGSIKRVASVLGEGAMAVRMVHDEFGRAGRTAGR